MADQLSPDTLSSAILAPLSYFSIADQTTGDTIRSAGSAYAGPVSGIIRQYVVQSENVAISPDNLNITALRANVFIHSGSGTDALDVSNVGGTNILDGGTGSNFLVGGTAGNGSDTFFVDDRNPTKDVFSTVKNFHSGDDATIFGVNSTDYAFSILDNQGAAGSTGIDFAFSKDGLPNANFVLAGYSTEDIIANRLVFSFGTTPTVGNIPGSEYLLIHAA
jgi:hypothetical protein